MSDLGLARRQRRLLASTCVAALLIAAGASSARAACPVVITGASAGCTNAATITGINIQGAAVTGSIANTGVISPNGISVNTGSTITGQINDSGTLFGGIAIDRTSKIASTNTGIFISGRTFGGGVNNAGVIAASNTGIVVDAVRTFTGGIANTGLITSSNRNGIVVVGGTSFSGGISNGGAISAAGAGVAVSNITNFIGGIENTNAITARTGIFVSRVAHFGASNAGGITNSGAISVTGEGIAISGVSTFLGGVGNSGTITGGQFGLQLFGVSTFSGGVSNGGTIAGTVAAIDIFGGRTFAGGISNSGLLSAGGSGIIANGMQTFAGAIANSGRIIAAGNAINVTSITQFGTSAVGGITNSGAISAGGAGILVSNVTRFGTSAVGGVTNSGTISAGGAGIAVGGVQTFFGGIANNGMISAATGLSIASVATFVGQIANTGTISATGTAILIQSADSVSVFNSGTLVGASGTAIQFSGGTNTLTLGAGYAITGNVIGAGADIFQLGGMGIGTFDLSTIGSAQQYQGFTTFNVVSGVWDLTGAFGQSQTWNVNGGTLAGTGTLNSVDVNAGGTLAPGPLGGIGSMAINGTLTFNAGSTYSVTLGATRASSAAVSGTATLTGADVVTAIAPGGGVMRTYVILTSGSLGGTTFTGLINTDPGFVETLSYQNEDVVLNLTAALGAGARLNQNQQNVATGLNTYFNNVGTLPPAFVSLFALSSANVGNGLSQVSGEAAAGAKQSAFQFGNSFLSTMLDPHGENRGGGLGQTGGFGAALGYAGDEPIPSAFSALAKDPAAAALPRWTFWGAAFGGEAELGGNGAIGSQNTSVGAAGFAAGGDYHIAPDTMVGFALAGGGTNWSLSNSLGKGNSAAFQAGLYGAHEFGPAYISGALAFGDFGVTTNRTVTLPGGDTLNASFNAQSYSARLESGYHIALAPATLTPYAALQVQDFEAPAYGETAANGANAFALRYAAQSATDARFELGAWADKTFVLPDGNAMKLFGRAAWTHDWQSNSALQATFLTLPAVSFAVTGARPAPDQALLTAGLEWRFARDWTATAKLDGEVGGGSHTYAATGRVSYAW